MVSRRRRREVRRLLAALAPLPSASAHDVACALGTDGRGPGIARGRLHGLLACCLDEGLVAAEPGADRRRYWLTALGAQVLADLAGGRPRHPEVGV